MSIRQPFLVLMLLGGMCVGCGQDRSAPAAGRTATTTPEKVVDLFVWADDIDPEALSAFEKSTGIKVRQSFFDSPETLESRMMAGHSGFDLAVPTAAFVRRQIRSGAYVALDKSRLPNLSNLDPALMARVAVNDPDNAHGIVYTWGTMGIGVNRAAVRKLLPAATFDSWRLVFDPAQAARVAKCGLSLMDDPVGIVRIVLQFLGRSVNAPSEEDLAAVERVLLGIRPFIRNIDTAGQIQALANGDLCVVVAYNGTVVQARRRALEASLSTDIAYVIPQEGSLLWFDLMAIPRDAPHLDNAYRFLNFLLEPPVIAGISRVIGYANANRPATALLPERLSKDPAVYPTPAELERLITQVEPTPQQDRAITRLWQRFKTAQ